MKSKRLLISGFKFCLTPIIVSINQRFHYFRKEKHDFIPINEVIINVASHREKHVAELILVFFYDF